MNRIPRWRWRLARWIAPAPIIAKPFADGSAILLRDSNGDAYVWIQPKTLDIKIENRLIRPAMDPLALGTYQPSGHRGTITGTI